MKYFGGVIGLLFALATFAETPTVRGEKVILSTPSTSHASINFPPGTSPTSPVDGDKWYNSAQQSLQKHEHGNSMFVDGTLFSQTGTVTVANTVTETSILNGGVGTLTVAADTFVPGKTLKVRMRGFGSETANPTIRIRVKLNSTLVGDTGAVTYNVPADGFWTLDFVTVCRTSGATGTVVAIGRMLVEGATPSSTEVYGLTNTSPITINTTIAQTLDVTWEWGTADPANTTSSIIGIVEVKA